MRLRRSDAVSGRISLQTTWCNIENWQSLSLNKSIPCRLHRLESNRCILKMFSYMHQMFMCFIIFLRANAAFIYCVWFLGRKLLLNVSSTSTLFEYAAIVGYFMWMCIVFFFNNFLRKLLFVSVISGFFYSYTITAMVKEKVEVS